MIEGKSNVPSESQTMQTLIVMWAAHLISQIFLGLMVYFVKPELRAVDFSQPIVSEHAPIISGFLLLAVSLLVASFFVRRRIVLRAITTGNVEYVQTALIVAHWLCEAATLIGLLTAFVFDYQYFFVFIALGIFGILLHFPLRREIQDATFKK